MRLHSATRQTPIASGLLPRLRITGLVLCTAAVAACGTDGVDKSTVRTGPQEVHPGSTAAPTRTRRSIPANKLTRAQAARQANALFDRYCLSGKSNAAIARSLRASGKFKELKPLKIGAARYEFYQLTDGTRGGVSLIYNSIGGLRCSVGIENVGPNLFENGRITRPKV